MAGFKHESVQGLSLLCCIAETQHHFWIVCLQMFPSKTTTTKQMCSLDNEISHRYQQESHVHQPQLESPAGRGGEVGLWIVVPPHQDAQLESPRKRARACTLAGPSHLHRQSLLGMWRGYAKHFMASAPMICPWFGVQIVNVLQF